MDDLAKLKAGIEQRISEARRATTRQLWIVCAVFLLLMAVLGVAGLLLVPTSTLETLRGHAVPEGAGDTEFLKVFVPLFVIAFGFLVGLLGLRRLEQFDAEINRLRSNLSQQLLDERKLTAADRTAFREDFDAKVAGIREDIRAVAETYVAGSVANHRDDLVERMSQFEQSTTELIERIQADLRPYAWLQERKGEVDYLAGIYTIGIAHDRVTEFFSQHKHDLALRVAEHAIREKLPGTPDDFHNLASELANQDLESLAMQVVENGLEAHPNDVDLLADGTKFGSATGDLTRAAELYEQLRLIDPGNWSWRAFVFAGDYLKTAGRIDEAMAIYTEFREQLPDDERAYSQPGSHFAKLGRYREAVAILEEGLRKCRWCAQTAMILSTVYKNVGEYQKAIATADRGLEANAADQPTAKQAALLWKRAEAQDALIHRLVQKRSSRDPSWEIDEEIICRARECVIDYETSMKMSDATYLLRLRGPERLEVLRALLRKNGAREDQIAFAFAAASDTRREGAESAVGPDAQPSN